MASRFDKSTGRGLRATSNPDTTETDKLRLPSLIEALKGDNTDLPSPTTDQQLQEMRAAMREQFKAFNVRKALLESRNLLTPWRHAKWLLDEMVSRGLNLSPVLVTGSASFDFDKGENMEAACHILGKLLRALPDVVLLTGGMKGVGQTVGKAFYDQQAEGAQLIHVLPTNCKEADPVEGDTFHLGANFPERQLILGMSSKINCLIGGGPGSMREANATLYSGNILLPVACAGGVGGGLTFDLPDAWECSFDFALARSRALDDGFISPDDWARLNDPKSSPEDTAQIIISALSGSA
jgi:predicted Rossmann-fold nucleotide-binding protein